MYARNVSAFLRHVFRNATPDIDVSDEIVRETLLTRDGELVNAHVREFFGK
jgi:H+-translocating NAD(P) transhydrogenase subunit alpha